MSQEQNGPNLQYTPQPTPGKEPQRKNSSLIYIGIIVALLAACIYLFLSRNSAVQRSEATTDTLTNVNNELQDVQSEYDAALSRLDLLVGKNAELDSMVTGKDSEIKRLKGQITGILSNSRASSSDLARARSLISSLNGRVRSYEEQIAQLEADNGRLSSLNEVVTKERDSTVTTNIALAQKVRLGAVLHASNIRMKPIDLRRGGKKEKETERANRVDVLRITFDIDENRIVENGVKDLYLRIVGPKGNLLSNGAYGSGVSETFDGQTLNYTLAKQIDLKQATPVQNVVADWHQDSDYDRGLYKIEIYNEGYKIGSGSVTLR